MRRIAGMGHWFTEAVGGANIWERREDKHVAQQHLASSLQSHLNADQRVAFDTMMECVAFTTMLAAMDGNSDKASFYLHGAGGTGKTFLYRALSAHLQGKVSRVS
ncbi:uncharacterized protein N7515_004138 [Penicillium bovifimosum]|uniref:ATP-dependent DNA helicase n=1 Tax=Penicillium bovifimosum TaxID=126998 RepID=A0A9W9L6W7_9EURO|nr:uncharacterized protein N7515_004138 [Penicillium bovifimosum]KAJ5139290.1 hypothetical protein N7515_004138 [Penicillium bovifimosum]